MKFSFYIILLLCTLSISPIHLTVSDNDWTPDYWPTDGWQISTPEEQGMINNRIQDLDNYIESSDWTNNLKSLLVIRNGYIVYEKYRFEFTQTFPSNIYSCTKVITSSLMGICLEEGYINSLEDPILDYLPDLNIQNMDPMKERINFRHLLTMTSGLEWIDETDYYSMMDSGNPAEYVLSKPMDSEPGQEWNYNTGCSHVLSTIINTVFENGTANLAKNSLFDPLGIANYLWTGDRFGVPNGGTLLNLIPRDMAKIGYLYLNNGSWDGMQLISKEWVENSTRSHIELDFARNFGVGYGYKWWIYDWKDSFSARGSLNQNILVLPAENLVVVTSGAGYFPFEDLVDDYILSGTSSSLVPWIIGGSSVAIIAATAITSSILKKKNK
ncbi:serine hydrolase domain-containing protein [Promethearchaeum syntrophicum]|uniref:Serine hydrolase domain-containing protein n=1 Tax=Promethearchaeum syntrophicum TaxID=2594042 RepID=A0A5B9DED0_9ARCH|nr:serine hydrolase [Candidatus Prometheoarchaeum syntrophicum]QEE17669.1 Beta-lactamase [Candidatus Prometheoarchaeum syntrophicum]